MGLLKPAKIDRQNNYRYYCASQLPRLNRILVFKELGFSLEQIGCLLDENISIIIQKTRQPNQRLTSKNDLVLDVWDMYIDRANKYFRS